MTIVKLLYVSLLNKIIKNKQPVEWFPRLPLIRLKFQKIPVSLSGGTTIYTPLKITPARLANYLYKQLLHIIIVLRRNLL